MTWLLMLHMLLQATLDGLAPINNWETHPKQRLRDSPQATIVRLATVGFWEIIVYPIKSLHLPEYRALGIIDWDNFIGSREEQPKV